MAGFQMRRCFTEHPDHTNATRWPVNYLHNAVASNCVLGLSMCSPIFVLRRNLSRRPVNYMSPPPSRQGKAGFGFTRPLLLNQGCQEMQISPHLFCGLGLPDLALLTTPSPTTTD